MSGSGDLLYHDGRYREAVAAYDRALKTTSGLEGAWLGKGNALSRIEKPYAALYSYNRALALDPGFTDAQTNRTRLLATHGLVWIPLGESAPLLPDGLEAFWGG